MVLGVFYSFVIKIMQIREWIQKICSLKIVFGSSSVFVEADVVLHLLKTPFRNFRVHENPEDL